MENTKPKKWRRLIEARKINHFTQAQMAEACGVTEGTYGRWEALLHEPSVTQLKTIAFMLNVPVGWLVGDTSFEPYADAYYWYNVNMARQLIAGQIADPRSFLFEGEDRHPITKDRIVAWVTDKLDLDYGYFDEADLEPAFPDAFRREQGDNEEAERYFTPVALEMPPRRERVYRNKK